MDIIAWWTDDRSRQQVIKWYDVIINGYNRLVSWTTWHMVPSWLLVCLLFSLVFFSPKYWGYIVYTKREIHKSSGLHGKRRFHVKAGSIHPLWTLLSCSCICTTYMLNAPGGFFYFGILNKLNKLIQKKYCFSPHTIYLPSL